MSRTTCGPRLRQRLRRGENGLIVVAAICLRLMVTSARGGSLDSPAAPTDPSSAMYTAKDLYDRLVSGTNAPKRAGAFTEPTAGPTAGTMYTTDDIMATAPVTNASGAVEGAVLSGKTFWSLTQGAWGTRTGTIATVTLSPDNDTVAAGYYAATTLKAVDTDLAAGNIKTNVTVFGVVGTYAGSGGITNAPVPKTGQTNSYAPYDDGWNSTNKGVAWPNPRFSPVAETGAETNQIRDNLTGLIWARNANFAGYDVGGSKTWQEALDYIAATNAAEILYGGANDWRLPNEREMISLADDGRSYPALCNSAGTGQWVEGDPFVDVQGESGNIYWSSTTAASDTNCAWQVYFDVGGMGYTPKTTALYVWPVRGGQ